MDYKTASGRGEIYEDLAVGQKIAEISVLSKNDQSRNSDQTAYEMSLSGIGADHFSLEQQRSAKSGGYSLVLARQLDRETVDVYKLRLTAKSSEIAGGQEERSQLEIELR